MSDTPTCVGEVLWSARKAFGNDANLVTATVYRDFPEWFEWLNTTYIGAEFAALVPVVNSMSHALYFTDRGVEYLLEMYPGLTDHRWEDE